MGARKKTHEKPKRKFKRITFALSERECGRYARLCAYEKISFKQLIKKSLREYYKNTDMSGWEEVLDNQLDLFGAFDLFGNPVKEKK